MRFITSIILTLIALILPASASVKVEIYTIPGCPGCNSAKSMFDDRKIPYTEISLAGRRDLYTQMKERVNDQVAPSERVPLENSMTVPRIFINDKYIGGYYDLDGDQLDKIAAKLHSHSAATNTNSKNNES